MGCLAEAAVQDSLDENIDLRQSTEDGAGSGDSSMEHFELVVVDLFGGPSLNSLNRLNFCCVSIADDALLALSEVLCSCDLNLEVDDLLGEPFICFALLLACDELLRMQVETIHMLGYPKVDGMHETGDHVDLLLLVCDVLEDKAVVIELRSAGKVSWTSER